MNKMLITLCFVLFSMTMCAQDDPEYKMEIGAGLGFVNYIGDFNESLIKNLRPAASVMIRYNLDTMNDLKFGVTYGKLVGNASDVETYYPDLSMDATKRMNYRFNNHLIDASLVYEYNFWPYGTGRDYRGAKRLTPFIFAGIGATIVNGDKNIVTANIPMGLGLKYKIGERTNVGVDYSLHFSTSDKLDGMKDPYGIKSSGLFKNTDGYGELKVFVTYSFREKCRTCNKDF